MAPLCADIGGSNARLPAGTQLAYISSRPQQQSANRNNAVHTDLRELAVDAWDFRSRWCASRSSNRSPWFVISGVVSVICHIAKMLRLYYVTFFLVKSNPKKISETL